MINEVMKVITESGGLPLFVGGCVRDSILELNPKDIDVEVFGLSPEQLIEVLKRFGKVDEVGVSFGVIKLTTENEDFDFTLPRRDNKKGTGHKGFDVEVDHTMTLKEAASRRDFTINSISRNVEGHLSDPFNGIEDLQNQILRATSDHFGEDPLRVLRGFQFCGRFQLTPDPYTTIACESLLPEYVTLPMDRIHRQWVNWALKSTKPSMGLDFLRKCGWISLYPELNALINCQQDPEWHPEGDAWTHTLHVVDAASEIATRDQLNDQDRLELILGALCHDLGKPSTTIMDRGRWRSPNHAHEGVPLTVSFLRSIGFVGQSELGSIVKRISRLVHCHMDHIGVKANDRFVKRLSQRVAPSNLVQLVKLIEADHSGRPPLPKHCPEVGMDILSIGARLNITQDQPVPILQGRHLIGAGLTPAPNFKTLLNKSYDAQLDGLVDSVESALQFLGLVNQPKPSTGDKDVNDSDSPPTS